MNKIEGSNIKPCRKREWQILKGMKEIINWNNRKKKKKNENGYKWVVMVNSLAFFSLTCLTYREKFQTF
jgi:hypothetical protein